MEAISDCKVGRALRCAPQCCKGIGFANRRRAAECAPYHDYEMPGLARPLSASNFEACFPCRGTLEVY
jgi:hypothetical protein